MKDTAKNKKQLIAELEELRRQRVVEQAAERLRQHVLSMRTSEDLYSVAAAFLVEVRHLGIDTIFLSINIFEGGKFVHHYPVTVSYVHMGLKLRNENDPWIKMLTNEALIRYMPPEQYDQLPEQWKAAIEQIEIEKIRAYQTKSVLKAQIHNDESFVRNDWTGTESNLKQAIVHWMGDRIRIHIPFSQGVVSFSSRTDDEQQVETVALLAEVFSLGYMRFLDFERLEQQNHQARLEAAVQRVRAEATAMRQSSDVIKVMTALWQGVEEMIPLLEWCSLNIQDQEADVLRLYWAIKLSGGVTLAHFQADKVLRENIVEDVHLLGTELPLSFAYEHRWATREVKAHVRRIEDTAYQTLKQSWGAELAPGTFAGHSALNVPFGYGGIFIKGTETADFGREELAIVEAFADAVTLGYTRFLDLRQLEDQLQTARELQMSLMPTESPQIAGIDIAGRCEMVNHVGGDFYQYFGNEGKLSVCLADVTGHAMEAAVPVMMFSGVLESEIKHDYELGGLYASLNQTLHRKLDSRTLVCFALGELDTATHTMRVANGGCPHPYHYRAAISEIAELEVDAYPLGVRAETTYEVLEVNLETGDYVIFCSDGIIEAGNVEEDIFGFEQTAEVIQQGCQEGLSAEGLIDRLISAVKDFTGDVPQGDDITCMVVRVE